MVRALKRLKRVPQLGSILIYPIEHEWCASMFGWFSSWSFQLLELKLLSFWYMHVTTCSYSKFGCSMPQACGWRRERERERARERERRKREKREERRGINGRERKERRDRRERQGEVSALQHMTPWGLRITSSRRKLRIFSRCEPCKVCTFLIYLIF